MFQILPKFKFYVLLFLKLLQILISVLIIAEEFSMHFCTEKLSVILNVSDLTNLKKYQQVVVQTPDKFLKGFSCQIQRYKSKDISELP